MTTNTLVYDEIASLVRDMLVSRGRGAVRVKLEYWVNTEENPEWPHQPLYGLVIAGLGSRANYSMCFSVIDDKLDVSWCDFSVHVLKKTTLSLAEDKSLEQAALDALAWCTESFGDTRTGVFDQR